jgi:uncharacterized protein
MPALTGSDRIGPDWLRSRVTALLAPAPSPFHRETAEVQRRRRVVVVATLAVGTVLLGFALTRTPGSTEFYVLAAVLAAVWLIGGFVSGPLHLGSRPGRRPEQRQVLLPLLLGALAFAVFAAGAEIVHGIPWLHRAVNDIISRADHGSRALIVAITLVNGVAEEVFFRGAVYSAFAQRRPALWTTVCYTVVTAAAGNLMLVLAAALMGTVFALERRGTRGILASAITHVTWSVMMIYLLPR